MKKIMLIYPTGDLYQRGEDRCQVNISASIANSMRACNDLGYISSILKNDYQIFLSSMPIKASHLSVFISKLTPI